MSCSQTEWCKATETKIAELAESGIKAKKTQLPPELAEIGGGSGVSFALYSESQQVAALTRFDSDPQFTCLVFVNVPPDPLRRTISLIAHIIATQTKTIVSLQPEPVT